MTVYFFLQDQLSCFFFGCPTPDGYCCSFCALRRFVCHIARHLHVCPPVILSRGTYTPICLPYPRGTYMPVCLPDPHVRTILFSTCPAAVYASARALSFRIIVSKSEQSAVRAESCGHDCFDRVHSVLCLVKYERLLRFKNFIGNFHVTQTIFIMNLFSDFCA